MASYMAFSIRMATSPPSTRPDDATSGGLRPEMDRGDGLHLSAMGARVLGGLIAGALVPLGAEGRAASPACHAIEAALVRAKAGNKLGCSPIN